MSGPVSVAASCGRCTAPMAPVHGVGPLVASCKVCGAVWVLDLRMESSVAHDVMSAGLHPSVQSIMDLEDECPWLRSREGRKSVAVGCVPSSPEVRAA